MRVYPTSTAGGAIEKRVTDVLGAITVITAVINMVLAKTTAETGIIADMVLGTRAPKATNAMETI